MKRRQFLPAWLALLVVLAAGIFISFFQAVNARAETKAGAPITPMGDDPALKGYTLAWSDDFDGTKLDTEKWKYRVDSKALSAQKPENVSVEGGKLKIALKKEDSDGKHYTGGGVASKRRFKYGYYEARFKVPSGAGWHTSFWTAVWGPPASTGSRQEIDICENESGSPTRYSAGLHQWSPEHKGLSGQKITTPDLSADFHVWGCEFTRDKITYYFDGKKVHTADAKKLASPEEGNILLTAIGYKKIDDKKLPAVAEYDWVRFYEKK